MSEQGPKRSLSRVSSPQADDEADRSLPSFPLASAQGEMTTVSRSLSASDRLSRRTQIGPNLRLPRIVDRPKDANLLSSANLKQGSSAHSGHLTSAEHSRSPSSSSASSSYSPQPLNALHTSTERHKSRSPTTLPPAHSLGERDQSFELKIVQQPRIGAEAGFEKVTLGRLPIVPAPVVQVIAKDARGHSIEQEFPYLFCSCALRQRDGVSPVDAIMAPIPRSELTPPSFSRTRVKERTSEGGEEFSALVGNLVRNAQRVTNLEGEVGNYFVFDDVSVRESGTYTLEFRLGEMQRSSSPRLASVVSDPFEVVNWRDYPGRPAQEVVTDLSRHLADQGITMYMPPLQNPPPVFD